MAHALDVSVTSVIAAPPDRVRAVMFDARRDPAWMKAVRTVEPIDAGLRPGARVRRIGRFVGRPLRWTTEVRAVSDDRLHLEIVDGPMRGEVTYTIAPHPNGSVVTVRNTGAAPGFAPRWLLAAAMRRSLTADLHRLKTLVEANG